MIMNAPDACLDVIREIDRNCRFPGYHGALDLKFVGYTSWTQKTSFLCQVPVAMSELGYWQAAPRCTTGVKY
jgi:hypothetical protein